MSLFNEPELGNVKLRIAVMGMSFTGKTYSSLLLARGIVGEQGKIAVIDCEGGQADIYKDVTPFKSMKMMPPYTPERFIEYIQAAESEGFDAVIVDTISHEWAGEGGLIEAHDEIAKASSNRMSSFSSWSEITPRHNALFNAILRSKIHVICTMRMKSATCIDVVDGRNVPVKIGLAPVQRDNCEYEFSIILEMDPSHTATVKKDRTGDGINHVLGDTGTIFKPSVQTGKELRNWLDGLAPGEPVFVPDKETKVCNQWYDEAQVESIKKQYKENGWNEGIFVSAKQQDGLYNRESIDADFKNRKKLDAPVVVKKPMEVKPKEVKPTEVIPKDEAKPKTVNATIDAESFVCSQCGASVNKVQADVSNLFKGAVLCKKCMK